MSMTKHAQNPAANRLDLDYRSEAARLGAPIVSITDVHSHINGARACRIYRDVADLYGIHTVYSMTHLEYVDAVQSALGADRLRLIAVPNWFAKDRLKAFTTDWIERIEAFAALGCRICKFWAAPRTVDIEDDLGVHGIFALDSEWARRRMEAARACGMMFMTHIADPDTWFASKYSDARKYGTKADQYIALERMLAEYADIPWLAAHMGGSPENLRFLDGLLRRHPNLHLDSSATKWMVREISKHRADEVVAFMKKWKGRILFGSDIVTTDEHLKVPDEAGESSASPMARLAGNEEQAFELYASRYYVLRHLWETDIDCESPIADPDLHMMDAEHFTPMDAPRLLGKALPHDILRSLYQDAAQQVLEGWRIEHT